MAPPGPMGALAPIARTMDEPRWLVIGQINGKHRSAVVTYRQQRHRPPPHRLIRTGAWYERRALIAGTTRRMSIPARTPIAKAASVQAANATPRRSNTRVENGTA